MSYTFELTNDQYLMLQHLVEHHRDTEELNFAAYMRAKIEPEFDIDDDKLFELAMHTDEVRHVFKDLELLARAIQL